MLHDTNKKGFSLIELIVVIAIIGVIAGLLLPNFMGARERARDTTRKSDLKQLQKALESYRQDQNPVAYPTVYGGSGNALGVCGGQLGSSTVYMAKIPCDPLNTTPTPYYYNPDNTNLKFTLCSCLDNKGDADATGTNCPGTYTCSSSKSYTVTEP
ncbi:prepilin-type N-terminal cleavage/methylation domain-containing protein [Candidatus Roizmanbacteria bacterium]|nr:prepilin-type N-terminal cleavage/methylation domain-containing protein [Candidatus Roizmanbacteria bacterium]